MMEKSFEFMSNQGNLNGCWVRDPVAWQGLWTSIHAPAFRLHLHVPLGIVVCLYLQFLGAFEAT